MSKIVEDIKIASDLFKKDRIAKRYMLLASELLVMIEMNNRNNPPTANSTTKNALFNTIVDAYNVGFVRGVQYVQNIRKADHEPL